MSNITFNGVDPRPLDDTPVVCLYSGSSHSLDAQLVIGRVGFPEQSRRNKYK